MIHRGPPGEKGDSASYLEVASPNQEIIGPLGIQGSPGEKGDKGYNGRDGTPGEAGELFELHPPKCS